ncbi:MAG: biotin transporter BioY [Candidatus Omnitrophica bacterium]|jgi:biotin transport system substrate-specific component|nr:biotin transporter BioY [Candidatus Omnitrophota bacterium]MDD5690850.1 biotin transporter BioY [Candidatus Omnitrophota bacterium]
MESTLSREVIINKRILRFLAVAVFITLITLSAFVRIPLPLTPVPLTLQTLFVLLSGALLGRRLGVFAQVGYLVLGLTGFQVFTGLGSGSLYLFGPTGGYIVGFVLASFFTGSLFSEGKPNRRNTLLKFLCADFIILFSGMLWLKVALSCSFSQAFLLAFLPFVPGDLLKVMFATVVFDKIHSRIKASLY